MYDKNTNVNMKYVYICILIKILYYTHNYDDTGVVIYVILYQPRIYNSTSIFLPVH